MKLRLIVVAFIIAAALPSKAQDAIKYRVYETCAKNYSTNDPCDFHAVPDYLLVITDGKMKVYLPNRTYNYDIVGSLGEKTAFNNNKSDNYKAVDQDGKECTLEVIFYTQNTDGHLATIIVRYDIAVLAMRLKKNN